MDKDNPACYECPKSATGIHYWQIIKGIATCSKCKLILTKAQTKDMIYDH